MENPIKMDDLGEKTPYFWFNTHMTGVSIHDHFRSLLCPTRVTYSPIPERS